jgi:hypothetical protein
MVRTVFTVITPLPASISRETVLATLHDHLEMIDLNPSHEERHMIKPPPEATPEEYHCQWYAITDKVSYLPAGMITGKVHFKSCFHDLSTGLQTHVYAPMGLDIKTKWTLGGNLPNEPVQPAELGIGAPIAGLYLRLDVEMRCNFLMTRFVKKTLKDSCASLVARLLVKSQLQEAVEGNRRLTTYRSPSHRFSSPPQHFSSPPSSPPLSSPLLSSPLPRYSVTHTPMASPPISPPYTANLNGEMRPAWAQEDQSRYSYKSHQPNSPGPVGPHDPSDYERVPIPEMDAVPPPAAELA